MSGLHALMDYIVHVNSPGQNNTEWEPSSLQRDLVNSRSLHAECMTAEQQGSKQEPERVIFLLFEVTYISNCSIAVTGN